MIKSGHLVWEAQAADPACAAQCGRIVPVRHELLQHMARLANPPSPSGAAGAEAPAVLPPGDSYACDPEPFDGNFNRCQGFLLQCRLVFSQHAWLFPFDKAKINFIIGLLRGRVLT